MPRQTPDVLLAASKVVLFNANLVFHPFIVIRSPHSATYAVTTLETLHLHRSASPAYDWEIAINLPSLDLLALMGIKTPIPSDLDTCTLAIPEPDPHFAPAAAIPVSRNASGA